MSSVPIAAKNNDVWVLRFPSVRPMFTPVRASSAYFPTKAWTSNARRNEAQAGEYTTISSGSALLVLDRNDHKACIFRCRLFVSRSSGYPMTVASRTGGPEAWLQLAEMPPPKPQTDGPDDRNGEGRRLGRSIWRAGSRRRLRRCACSNLPALADQPVEIAVRSCRTSGSVFSLIESPPKCGG